MSFDIDRSASSLSERQRDDAREDARMAPSGLQPVKVDRVTNGGNWNGGVAPMRDASCRFNEGTRSS